MLLADRCHPLSEQTHQACAKLAPSPTTTFAFDAVQLTNDGIMLVLALYGLWLIRGSVVQRGATDSSNLSFGDSLLGSAQP